MIQIIASLIRYFLGYVDFEAFGTDIEKFITLLAKDGIEIISQKKKKYMFYGRIYAKDYLKIRPPYLPVKQERVKVLMLLINLILMTM